MSAEVELFDDLDAVARDAAGALDRERQASLFDRLDWYRLTQRHIAPAGRPLVARARDGEARAWLFLSVERATARALRSWYSLSYGIVTEAGRGDAAPLARAIAAALRSAKIARVSLAPLDPASPLPAAFREAGWIVREQDATVNWFAITDGIDFDTYWARRPGKLRNTAKRKAKATPLDIRIHDRFDEQAWRDYDRVYQASWKPAEGSPAFLDALVRQEGAAGTLRLGVAYQDGAPLAAQLWLVENGVATIHKLAYVAAARDLSPGTILSAAMFRHVIDRDRPRLIDFGTGDDGYKADWMDDSRALRRLETYNPLRLAGIMGAARAAASALVRRVGRH